VQDIYHKLQTSSAKNFLKNSLIGIERESLRTNNNGLIATTPHPQALGATLTHPYITTDFAESLIEIVTPPQIGVDNTLNFLENTLHFVYNHLENNEKLWVNSMPCVIRGKSEINIAKYGSSNQGQMKEIYRLGLANRYGKAMQVVAGVHLNYSFSDNFWREYQNILGNTQTLREFKDEKYMHLIRNVLRYGWLLYYFFGASNSVCASFLKNYKHHKLEEFNENTLYGKYATSLRMSDIGYQNSKEDESGIKANYNSIKQYAHSLQDAMSTSYDEYEKIGVIKNNKYQQLNANILQIENEYYSSVRPKPKAQSGVMPSISLLNNGIEYIELRAFDLNPLTPLGITKEQILFTESFLLFCLLEDSKPISTKEQVDIDNNNLIVAEQGLNPQAKINCKNGEFLISAVIKNITTKLLKSAEIFSGNHQNVVKNILNTTPISAKILTQMTDEKLGFHDFADDLANQHKKYFQQQKINTKHFDMLANLSQKSLQDKAKLEQDSTDFAEFLTHYFSQL
jgi:glutamate--cysteine ligase